MKLIIAVASLAICPAIVFAGVQGTPHDLSSGPNDLCFACHVPHNAAGDNLWARDLTGISFGGVQQLCYSCHNGDVSIVGSGTAFSTTLEQHLPVGSDCSGTGACHDVHNAAPGGGTTGRFVVVDETSGSYCVTCHDATAFGSGTHGDHTAGTNHFTNGGTFNCEQCHTVHGAVPQTTNPGTLTRPILLADNTASGAYGDFCASCHNGTAPAAVVPGTGGIAASDVHDYVETGLNGANVQHPTMSTSTSTNWTGSPVGGCNKCHDVHDPNLTPVGYILMETNTDSGYCVSCHDGTDAPGVGTGTHPTGIPVDINMNSGLTPALPWAQQIDEDGVAGADWASATTNRMVCETCHSVHKLGFSGTGSEYFLRHANGTNNELCSACHQAN